MTATELLVRGGAIHLTVDWLLGNEWMAAHKTDVRHPAGWVRAGIHGSAPAAIFPPLAALAPDVHLWRDQALHVATIAAAALVVAAS